MLRHLILVAALATCLAGAAASQQTGIVRSPVLVIDTDQLYATSAFGQRVAADLQARGEALAAENRRIEGDLEAEERSLTEQRKTMTPDAFRVLADAFDEKVTQVRRAQSAKTQALNAQIEEQQIIFLQAAAPVLEGLMRDAGAAVILNARDVFLSVDAVDVTSEAVTRIDRTLGDGTPTEQPD